MRRILLSLCLLWLLCPAVHAAFDSSDGNFYLLRQDGNETYTVDGSVIFKTYKGTPTTYRDNGVTFYPTNPGEIIQATIQEMDLPSGAATLVYTSNIAAVKDKIGKSGNSSSGSGYSYMPAGFSHEFKTTDGIGAVIQSEDESGAMSFGFHCTSFTTTNKGFTILIESVSLKDMEYVSTTWTSPASTHRGALGALLGTLTVKTDGSGNPLSINGIAADVSALEGIAANVRLTDAAGNLLATCTDGATLSYNVETTLRSGANTFNITGDIAPDFTGSIAALTAPQVTVAGESRSVESSAAAIAVENAIHMTSEATVFNIGEAAAFYDDGGPDGKISANFNGSVTFVPTTPGHKIKVDVSKLAIFYNSSAVSVGNQDVFNFYNGRAADADNLVATLTTEGRIIKSTADDGSLTVTLTSKTGYPADGWEATVSEFLPGDMTLTGIEATTAGITTASAYDTDVVMAIFNVKADNILNPLVPEALTVSVNGAPALTSAKVISFGDMSSTAVQKIAGTADIASDGNLTVTLNDIALGEGNNYFALAVDVAETASNGDVFTVKPVSVKIGETEHAVTVEPDAVTVANIFSHHEGIDLRNIHDVWQFVSTPDPNNSYKYLLKDADCIVTFVPAEGSKAELEFSEFDVYYGTGYYGAKATFEIYSGRTKNSNSLLWKRTAAAVKPEGKIRSTADDGSITVVFNAKTSTSTYAGKGWKATVTPFVDHNMTVEGISVAQPYSGDLTPGANGENLLDFAIETEGTLDSRKLTSVGVSLKNCRQGVTAVSVVTTDAEGKTVTVGTAQTGDSDDIEIPCEATLIEGSNNFTVTVDINPDVTPDLAIDAKITSVTTDAGKVEVENGDPDGSRTAKYQYLMSDGDHIVTVGNAIHFYDDGGASGNVNKNGLNGTVIFQPADPYKKIRITVVSYATANTGTVDFYAGRSAGGDHLGQCKLRTFPELPVVSLADDGAMFVKVSVAKVSYGSYAGWDMIVEQYVPTDLYASDVKASSAADAETLRGSVDVPMSNIAVAVEGDRETLSLTALSATVGGTDIADVTAVKLWSTGKGDAFTPTVLLASATPDTEGAVTFADIVEPEAASSLGTYHYWLTVDIAPGANPGNIVTVTPGELSFSDGTSIPTTSTEIQTTTLKAGFAGGEFVIGASDAADYPTFAAATAAIAGGIEGPVKFLIEPGTYAENILVENVKGTSETNTITFTSQSGKAEDVTLTGAGYTDPGYGGEKYGIFSIKNTAWVTVDHISFYDATTYYPYYVYITNASRHNTVSNCVMTAQTSTSYSGLNMIYTTMTGEEANGKNPDYLTVEGNSFTGGYTAVYAQGSNGYVRLDPLYNLTVRNNTFTDCGSKGVYPYQVKNLVVDGNTFTAGTAVTKTSYFAIDANRISGDIDICNNVIVNNQTVYSGGIELRSESHGTAGRPARIYNNAITVTASPNSSTVGLTIASDCSNIEAAHNTVNINGTAGHAIAITGNSTPANVRFVNNIARVNAPGSSASYAFNIPKEENIVAVTFANNAMFSNSKLSNIAATAEAWTAKTGDESLIAEEAKFVSEADLHLAEAGSMVAGSPVDYVTADLDGTARHATTPTLGAYEFAEMSQDKPEMAEGYPAVASVAKTSARIRTKWTLSGKQHHLVVAADAEAPSADELLATAGTDVAADTESLASFTGLTEATAYKAYFILAGANGLNSEVASIAFTTAYPTLEAMLDEEQDDIDAGQTATIEAGVWGGAEPYAYRWFDRNGNLVGSEAVLTVTPSLPEVYTLNVTSADGQTASAFTALKVYGSTADADFEDNALAPNSYWWGTGDEDIAEFPFFSGSFAFGNFSSQEYQAWAGFAYANCTDTTFPSLFPGQFHNVTGHGYNSGTYAVVYSYGYNPNIEVLANRAGAELSHVYVTNSSYLYNSATHGDSFAQPFAEGDYHKVIFTGDDPEGTPVEYYLADYRTLPGTILTDWERVDLTPLGKHVRNINVRTESSNSNVPAYAVLDNLAYKTGSTGIEDVAVDASDIAAVRVYSLDGALRLTVDRPGRLIGSRDLASLAAGIYIVEYTLTDGTTAVRKVAR